MVILWTLSLTSFELKNEYSTAYSQAVTHPSTNAAQCCLTSVIGRELVFSTWYGRIQECDVRFVPMDILSKISTFGVVQVYQ